ncbi:pimeloyl-CoA dehydrogenase large subunit [Roseomonas sp. JC162]|uniref:Pimeloyl-CoA dehydrogenase large subunit n=1 Tax=Neoroseomonas marina TaxID=1232220 RepID=A0A848EL04_9PROT|nr:acyl-CoA dehydrogenase family protein [Neoroseomonas marina]NMJ44449.1 pimeloyl-CoA dehydrogenase large subunit [Neoroseomonas marina]
MGGVPAADELDGFRAEVRGFLTSALPRALAARAKAGHTLSRDELMFWHRVLHERGWVAPGWPRDYGGAGWTILQRHIFDEESARAGAPSVIPMALTIVGPLLIAHGTDEQRARYLPRILDGSEIWCQGWSEPEAGSDLASLRCHAERVGDEYVINGTKIWTTFAQWADRCMLLARTASGDRRQFGITILLVDMRRPGVSVRPLPSLDGMHVLNQVYFDDVRVPVSDRVGLEDQGWGLLKSTVGHERILNADVGRARAMLDRLIRIVQAGPGAQPGLRIRIARAAIRFRALETLVLRALDSPDPANASGASLIKVRGTELQQELSWLMSEALGLYGLPLLPDVMQDGWQDETPIGPEDAATVTPFYLFWRKASISAGTSEIMRNLIAQQVLGR